VLIDTHVHLNSRDLANDLAGVLTRAEAAGVQRFVVVGYDLASSERAVRLANEDSRLFATVGIHPHDAKHWGVEAEEALRQWAQNPRIVAIGEIGLDFYRDLSPRPAQYDAFRAQLRLAQEVDLPVVIHCRDAYDETLALLDAEAGETPIELHCFAGNAAHAERAWARGWYLGVGGTITYKKNEELREIVRATPHKLLLLETDAPYLSPEPLRGKFPNEPARVNLVAECVAAVRQESVADVTRNTTENARRFFARMATAG
jgi:TatD DNase family protein